MNFLALIHVELLKIHHNQRADIHGIHLSHRVVHRSVERCPGETREFKRNNKKVKKLRTNARVWLNSLPFVSCSSRCRPRRLVCTRSALDLCVSLRLSSPLCTNKTFPFSSFQFLRLRFVRLLFFASSIRSSSSSAAVQKTETKSFRREEEKKKKRIHRAMPSSKRARKRATLDASLLLFLLVFCACIFFYRDVCFCRQTRTKRHSK